MPRRTQQAAVAERTEAHLAEQRERRREAAQQGAQTRRQRREAQAAEAQPQAGAESRTQGHPPSPRLRRAGVARRSRPRAHPDATLRSSATSLRSTSLSTVANRGYFAIKMRALSEHHGMSLAKLLKHALLVYERDIEGGYQPGTSLRRWQESQAEGEERAE